MSRPSMTLEVNETIEAGQSMIMDSSTGRVSLAKMDKYGTIVGTAAEKFYRGDIITLKEGTHSVWEVKRYPDAMAYTTGTKQAARPYNRLYKDRPVNLSELNPYQTAAIMILTSELRHRLSQHEADAKGYAKLAADQTLSTDKREKFAILCASETAKVEALRLALKGLQG